jgi:transcriptional regulator GlxA family with amidase domain
MAAAQTAMGAVGRHTALRSMRSKLAWQSLAKLGRKVKDSSMLTDEPTPRAFGNRQDPLLLRRLLRARDRMDAFSHEDWTVERLACVGGVSKAHFARAFRQAFGTPPHRYLLTRRIERAKAFLRDTDLGITTIAFETGWNSLGTFGRIFREVTGESPSTFRLREQRLAHLMGEVPACYLSQAQRPDLTIAVSEKRRLRCDDTWAGSQTMEI